MEVNAADYSLKQLRAWLLALNQPVSGTKAVLAMRINQIPLHERGNCPALENDDHDAREPENELSDLESNADVMITPEASIGNNEEAAAFELTQVRKELELIKREKQLLEREKELMNRASSIESSVRVDTVSLSLLKEFMAEFDGSSDVHLWADQFRNLSTAYKLDEETHRALFICKMKGKAQKWLYSMPDFATKGTTALLNEVEEIFATKPDKLKVRKIFEMRKWKVGESFAEYCFEKSALAATMKMPEDELVEYIIDGIPDPQLRTQANVLCITTKKDLLKAYAKVELKFKTPKEATKAESDVSIRCFNCNVAGHFASECKKPKRELGTCFGCGSSQHRIAQCPKNKKMVMTISEDDFKDYVRLFQFYLVENSYLSFTAECLMDSGNPVSFIKVKCIKSLKLMIVMKNMNTSYVGLNKSKLKVYGVLPCFVKDTNNKKILLDLLVVADHSMAFDAVLGRDFLKKSCAKLIFTNEMHNDDEKNNAGKYYANDYVDSFANCYEKSDENILKIKL